MRNELGQFVSGHGECERCDVGTIRVRSRRNRKGETRAFIKVAEPNTWVLMARYVWEQAYGPIPRGMAVHHKDENKLNDSPDNLELVSRARHLEIHRHEFQDKCVAALARARARKTWSTRSATKRTGRPPTISPETIRMAVDDYRANGGPVNQIAVRHGMTRGALTYHLKKAGLK